ncbi:hypothetical protein CLV93_108108 [Prolixibacter denitrificans]|uniref:Uncharacterized protein n=1 Tax=Prolixibacter denitrificans TaxID=1541063 RepID=A0A2P8C9R6_9BACT|nr:hypothetical protein CLV93_108108 [Prolixibacter denitrificans]
MIKSRSSGCDEAPSATESILSPAYEVPQFREDVHARCMKCVCFGKMLMHAAWSVSVSGRCSCTLHEVCQFREDVHACCMECFSFGEILVTLQRVASVSGRYFSRCNEVPPFPEDVRHAATDTSREARRFIRCWLSPTVGCKDVIPPEDDILQSALVKSHNCSGLILYRVTRSPIWKLLPGS